VQENPMTFKMPKRYRGTIQTLNVIPLVDILFLLIIFFSLMGQLLETDNLSIALPGGCNFAADDNQVRSQITTLTLIRDQRGKSDFTVGSQKIEASNYNEIVNRVAELLDSRLKELPAESKVVTLRIDKDVPYSEAQYALAGIAKSSATDIRLAAFKDNPAVSQSP
jgi:biopolymer transport protein ExbD